MIKIPLLATTLFLGRLLKYRETRTIDLYGIGSVLLMVAPGHGVVKKAIKVRSGRLRM